MELRFSIKASAAYAPGLEKPADWQAWCASPFLPTGNEAPSLPEMPAMMRRRVGPLGRMAAQAAYRCQGDRGDMPVVFSSRYGDAERSLGLLRTLARDESVSPTDFGLSVHNGIGAQYSIARSDNSNFISVAGGAASAAAGLVESAALLEDGADEVMLVNYDGPLPGEYARFHDETACCYAWAIRLTKPESARAPCICLSLSPDAPSTPEQSRHSLPFGLDVWRFFLGNEPLLRRSADGCAWIWQRYA